MENNISQPLPDEAIENVESELESEETPQMKKLQDIFHVCKLGFLIPVQNLVDKCGPDILLQYDKDGHTPVHWAALGGHVHLFHYFIQIKAPLDIPAKTSLGSLPIHWACVHGHIQVIQLLIQNGVSIDIVDNKGCSPLIISAQYGQTVLAAFLIGKGARTSITDKEGDNALHWAAFKGHCELTRMLIYTGLNPEVKDNFGQYALHLAALSGDLLTLQLLCEQDGVDIEACDHNNNTALMLAKGRKHKSIIEYLQRLQDKSTSICPEFDYKSIIFGPPGKTKHAFAFLLAATLLYGYPCYLFRVLPYTLNFQFSHFIFFIVTVSMWFCLFKAYTMDPGFLPLNTEDYDTALKQAAYFVERKSQNSPLKRLCHTCRLVKPFRAKHCKITNRCVQHFDHYCPYIYNDIGYKNRHYFFGFIFCMTFTLLYGDFFVWYKCKFIEWDNLLFVGGLLLLFFSIINLGLLGVTVHNALTNITTNEMMNRKRYSYLKNANSTFENPFNQGFKRNILEYFHLKSPLVLEDDPALQLNNRLMMV